MKRICSFLAALVVAAFVASPPASAQQIADQNSYFRYEAIPNRHTSASGIAQNLNWAAPYRATGFKDSLVFRRGVTTRTVYDTTIALPTIHFPFPPSVLSQGGGISDTLRRWIAVRVRQDTTSMGFTGTSGLDSVRVAAEYSYDGINWLACAGTPTYRFDTVFMTSGFDGTQSPTLIGVEGINSEDAVEIPFKCNPAAIGAQSYIVNSNLCVAGNYFRFIIGGAYSGQFVVELGSWHNTSGSSPF